eukprot:scaffold1248_cov170-Amphora_coffeaeformis.AAC.21
MVGRIQDEPAIQSIATYAAWRILAPPQIRRWYYNNNNNNHQRRPMEDPPREDEVVLGLIPWMLQILKLCLMGTILLLASGASYAIFYRAVMPSRYATVSLYFDYSPPVDMGIVPSSRPLFKLPKHQTPKLSQNVVPTASVDLFAKHVAWEPFHQTVAPPLLTHKRLLSARQAYYIEMLLFLPESIHNREAGLFGVVTDLQSSNQTTLARSTRWTQLPHESSWISFTRKLLCLPAFLLGALTEFRTIELAAFRHYVESRDFPLVGAREESFEPDCDLDIDFGLGGVGHDEAERIHERRDQEGEHEPRFEDWHDVDDDQSPPAMDRDVPIVPDDSPLSSSPRDHHDNVRANSEDDWEDIFYPATDREEVISIN